MVNNYVKLFFKPYLSPQTCRIISATCCLNVFYRELLISDGKLGRFSFTSEVNPRIFWKTYLSSVISMIFSFSLQSWGFSICT